MRGTRGATRSRGQRLLYPPPSLNLRFAETKSLTDWVSGSNLITFSRASSGTVVNAAGTLETVASNVPRFDHNPLTGESLGLLVEEARTNEVRNSNSMSAVVTGSPGTLPTNWFAQTNANGWTREVVGSGSIGEMNYVDIRLSGTTTVSQFVIVFQGQGIVSASNGQTWAPSVYHQLVAGSMGNIIGYPAANLWSSGGAYLGGLSLPGTIQPSSVLQRYTGSATIGNASTAFISWGITFVCTIGQTYDFTIRFALPQLEQGAFATSVIPTTGTAATRSADMASITGSNFSSWYRQDEGTVFADAASIQNGGRYFMFDDGIINDRWEARYSSWVAQLTSWKAGSADVTVNTNVAPASPALNVKLAAANKSNDAAIASNGIGNTVGTDNASSMPSAQSRFWIGSFTGTATYINGTIRRLTYWPQRLPNNTLIALTR